MPAFSYSTLNQLHQNIRALWYRRQRVGKLYLTHEEYIDTFVPLEAREHFTAIARHVQSRPQWHDLYWPTADGSRLKLNVLLESKVARPAPPYMHEHVVQPDAPQEVVDRINSWLTTGGDANRDFARVAMLLNKFNESCSRNTIRYYWPTIIPICAEHQDTKRFAEELAALKPPKNPAPLPRGLQQACRLTAETITTTLLIPTDVNDQGWGETTIQVATGQKYNEPDLGDFIGLS
jgi:hypothetical protein